MSRVRGTVPAKLADGESRTLSSSELNQAIFRLHYTLDEAIPEPDEHLIQFTILDFRRATFPSAV